MPVIKANQPLPEGAVIVSIYGEPGVSKTTLANTSDSFLLLDFDRGSARAHHRKDTLVINNWKDVQDEQAAGTFDNYKTIGIDTAKAALDDFLMTFVVERDPKLRSNKLGMYGAIGDEFKLFTNFLRNKQIDLVIIAHAKKDEDTKKQVPDITGQSFNLILRISDQVGFMSMFGNKRQISWNPTDLTVGKNTANLPTAIIPDKDSAELKTYMADIIAQVKSAKATMSQAQLEEVQKVEAFTKEIAACKDDEELTMIITPVQEQLKHIKDPLNKLIAMRGKELKLIYDKEAKKFIPDPAFVAEKKSGKKKETPAAAVPAGEQEQLDFNS